MGADHARIVAEELPGAVLSAISDPDTDRARAVIAGRHDVDVTANPYELISREDVDAIIVASPDFTHAPLSLAAIQAGKPILCEKPLSQDPAECMTVMEAEEAAGRKFVQVGFMRRYERSYLEMIKARTAGALGRILMMHNFHRNVSNPAPDFTGAMAISNAAPHEFDIARHVMTTEYKAISAFQPKRSDGLVAPVMMVLETVDEQIVNIEINNNAAYGYDVRAELVGETASIAMHPVAYTRLDHGLKSAISYDEDWRGRYGDAYRLQNRDFVEFARTGTFPKVAASAWDGYVASKVAQVGIVALQSGQRTDIDLVKKPALY